MSRWLCIPLAAMLAVPGCTGLVGPSAGGDALAVLVGAGDIGWCGSPGAEETARLLDGIPGIVFTAGDNAYFSGSPSEYRDCYDPWWGRHLSRTRPSAGNHDYETPGAAGYFAYYGALAGPAGLGYYSYAAGSWHVVVLNSNVSMAAGSPQDQWLRGELGAHQASCVLAIWHHPLFSSGKHGNDPRSTDAWRALQSNGADLVINGHEHLYERFAPQTADGMPDPRGLRQFTVGTGGAVLYSFTTVRPNSEVRYNNSFGVLKMTLRSRGYDWEFVSTRQAIADSGSASCTF